MATQVETLLPGNPLAKAEEHGKVIRGEPEVEEGGRGDGAKRQTGVAEQGSSSGSSPGQGGTPGTEEQPSKEATEESKEGCDSDEKQNGEGVKSRKEFTEAPPPKVNPWTRKMNAVTVVSVNGQAHHAVILGRTVAPSSTPFTSSHRIQSPGEVQQKLIPLLIQIIDTSPTSSHLIFTTSV